MPLSYELRGRVVDRLEFGRRGHFAMAPVERAGVKYPPAAHNRSAEDF